jgi:DNA protecting protein DprA
LSLNTLPRVRLAFTFFIELSPFLSKLYTFFSVSLSPILYSVGMEKMEEENIRLMTPDDTDWPALLRQIPQPPKRLFMQGSWPPRFADGTAVNEKTKFLCVVGARRHSSYGREACEALIAGLSGYNICIVSGLALGIDAVAHEAALAARIPTIAFPGSGLDPEVLYPPRNQRLGEKIIASGGALLSEYDMDTAAAPWCFPQRNRLMAGISHAVLIIEAKRPSGTLITSSLANDYGRDIFALPGDIFSTLSEGPHMLISRGAAIVTTSEDILHELRIKPRDDTPVEQIKLFPNELPIEDTYEDSSKIFGEKMLLKIIAGSGGKIHKDELVRACIVNETSSVAETVALISMTEIDGLIREENGMIHIVRKGAKKPP